MANSNNEPLNIKGSQKRLKCQKTMIILLFIIVPLSITFQILGYFHFMAFIDDILIMINAIWMLIFTKKGEISRRKNLGIFSLITCIVGFTIRFNAVFKVDSDNGLFILAVFFSYYTLTIEIIITSYNMICCCCDCNKCDN